MSTGCSSLQAGEIHPPTSVRQVTRLISPGARWGSARAVKRQRFRRLRATPARSRWRDIAPTPHPLRRSGSAAHQVSSALDRTPSTSQDPRCFPARVLQESHSSHRRYSRTGFDLILGLSHSANTLPVGLQVLNPRLVSVPILNFVELVGEYHALLEPDRLRPVLAALGCDVQAISDSVGRYRD
jgi:hypothetical protein